MENKIEKIEAEMMKLSMELAKLRKKVPAKAVPNYKFKTLDGEVTLLDLFAGKKLLFAIHNMGQGCRYCTLWGDGLNGFIPHLESEYAVAMVSKDDPETQRTFANSRGWRFRMASHGGGKYISEQSAKAGQSNMPGLVIYERKGDKIFRKNSAMFGPGDAFCSIWSMLSLAGIGEDEWVAQYSYWRRPKKLDDGGEGVKD